jgi:hypothetical protein
MNEKTNEKTDKKTFSSLSVFVACVCIAAYALALIVAGAQIGLDIQERRIAAERDFSDLTARSSRLDTQAFIEESFQEIIQNALANSLTLQGIILTGPNGEYAFERSLSGAINWVENSPRFAKQFGVSSHPFFSPLQIEGLRNVTLSAVYRYIDFDFLLSVLKRTLIIVLAALTAAFLALILESVTDKGQAKEAAISPVFPPVDAYPAAAEYTSTAERPSLKAKPAAGHSSPDDSNFNDDLNNKLNNELDNEFDDDSFDDVFRIDDEGGEMPLPATDSSSAGTDGADKTPVQDEDTEGKADEPETPAPGGIGRETNTRKRLDAELSRAESSGQDLAVVVLEYGNPADPEGAEFADFVRVTAGYFGSGNMMFEKGDTGITLILPGTNLTDAIKQVREFRNRIPADFAQGLAAGISSRLDRHVEANRLLLEAAEATVKSREDPENRVVAFKIDPEKYRAFIEKRS